MYDRINLVKRGIAFAGDCHQKFAQHVSKNPEKVDEFLREMQKRFQSPAAIVLLAVTFFSFVFLLCGIEYSIRFVATNLAIVEHTESSGRIALTDEPDAPLYKAPLLEDFDSEEQKLPLPIRETALPIKPITTGLRSTIRHLHSQEGFWSRFRGIRHGIFYMAVMGAFSLIFQALFAGMFGPLGFWLGSTTAAIVCCNAHATWTHATIAAPSEKRFFERFLPRPVARQLVFPTIRLHATLGMTHFVVATLARVTVHKMRTSSHPHAAASLGFLPIIAAIAMSLGMVLPSYIALIRTEASLLPEDMSAIVPFDRTFGGRFLQTEEPTAHRCAFMKKMTVRGAFMTFNRDTYKRTLKMLVKFAVVGLTIDAVFIGVLAAEIYIIAGGSSNIRKLTEIGQAIQRGEL